MDQQQASPTIRTAVRALALAAPVDGALNITLAAAEAAIPDDHDLAFDTTVRVFGTLTKKGGQVTIDSLSRVERENIEQPRPLDDGEGDRRQKPGDEPGDEP